MLVDWIFGQVGLEAYAMDWYNPHLRRMLMCNIAPPIINDHLSEYSATIKVWKANTFKIEMHLTREIYYWKLYTIGNILVVLCSKDMRTIFNSTIISQLEMEPRVHHFQSFTDSHNSTSKLSSPYPCCWYMHVFMCYLNGWACWKFSADWNGCHGLHCSGCWPCILPNTVALPYALAT